MRSPPISGPRPSFLGTLSPWVSFPGICRALSPHARPRGRAPPPSRATLICARFTESCEAARHIKASTDSICSAPEEIIVSSCCSSSSSCCDQAPIHVFDLSVSRSTAFSRHPPCAGRLRRLGPSLPCLFRYPPSRWSHPENALVLLDLEERGRQKKVLSTRQLLLKYFFFNSTFIPPPGEN